MKVTVGPSSNVAFQAATDRGRSSQINVTQNNTTKVTFSSAVSGTSEAAVTQANKARDQANTARTTANDAYEQANTARITGNNAYTQANNARDQANTARDQANNAYASSNNRVLRAGDAMTGTLNINFVGVGLNVNAAAEFSNSVTIGNSNSGIYMLDDINGFASVEIGGAQGGYIDFKMPIDEDYDFRIYSRHAQTEFISANTNHLVSFSGANVSFDTNTFAVDVVNNRVGVGTNTPSANLEVVGTANVSNTISTNTVNFGFGVYDLTSNTFQSNSDDIIEVDSFSASAFSTVKYIVQVKTGLTLHSTELFCIQDGVSTYMTEYATLITGAPLGTFSIGLSGGRMKLLFDADNPLGNILTFKVVRYTISS